MYVEILCPRCMAAVSGRVLSERQAAVSTPGKPPVAPGPANDEDEDSLTENDIVEAELTVTDDPTTTG
jgi:hypothetical protein